MDVDETLAFLGKYSRWHVLTYAFIAISTSFQACFQILNVVFIGAIPNYFCNVTDNRSIPVTVYNGVEKRDSCNVYVDYTTSNDTQPCPNGYTYDTDFTSTFVMDWELVCDYEYMKDLTQTICVVGVMFGAIVFTSIADKYGRKPVFLFASWGMVVTGVLCTVSPNYTFFCVVRFFMGAFQQGIMLCGFVMACEIFPANQRTLAGVFVASIWGVAMMVMALLAYFLRNWQHLELSFSLPWVVTIAGYWVIPESVPWLVANGRMKEAEQIIKNAAKFNNVELPPHLFADDQSNLRERINPALLETNGEGEQTKHQNGDIKEVNVTVTENPTIIFIHPKLRRYTLVMFFAWFVNSLVYYGLLLSTGDLAGDRYLNFFFSGLTEFIAYTASFYILQRFGRRLPLCCYHMVAAFGLIVSVFIPPTTADGTNLTPLVILFNMVGKFGIASSFTEIFLYAGEIFPTNVRSIGLGFCSVAARIAGMLAPFSSTVMRRLPWLPALTFGGLSIAAGALALFLPETLGRALPQNVQELDTWTKKRGRAKSFTVHAVQKVTPQEEDL